MRSSTPRAAGLMAVALFMVGCRGCNARSNPATAASSTAPPASASAPVSAAPTTPEARVASPLGFASVAVSTESVATRFVAALTDGSVWEWAGPTRRRVVGVRDAVEVTAGGEHACARLRDGTVVCWGRNLANELGVAGPSAAAVPVPVPGVVNARSVSAFSSHTCALLVDATVRCWGLIAPGSGPEMAPAPFAPAGAVGVQQLVASDGGFVAQMADGTIRTWSTRREGERFSLVSEGVSGVADVTKIAACGRYGCALRRDGSVSCWGWGARAAAVEGVTGAVEIACGEHVRDNENSAGTITYSASGAACALTGAGALRCWTHEGGELDTNLTQSAASDEPNAVPGSRLAMGANFDDQQSRCVWTTASARCNDAVLALPTPDELAQAALQPATPSALPSAATPSAAPSTEPTETSRCYFAARSNFHLRAEETPASEGPELPAGTELQLIAAGTLTRGATRIYNVRVLSDGREGYMFLARDELPAGCPFID